MLLLQHSLICAYNCMLLAQVSAASGMGIVRQLHRGSPPEGVMMYAGSFTRQHDRNDDNQVK